MWIRGTCSAGHGGSDAMRVARLRCQQASPRRQSGDTGNESCDAGLRPTPSLSPGGRGTDLTRSDQVRVRGTSAQLTSNTSQRRARNRHTHEDATDTITPHRPLTLISRQGSKSVPLPRGERDASHNTRLSILQSRSASMTSRQLPLIDVGDGCCECGNGVT
jgi:hypothetical protein